MPRRVLERIIELDEDACCPYGYFAMREQMTTLEIARETGLTPRNIRYWKRKVKLGKIVCHKKDGWICNKSLMDTIDTLLLGFHDSYSSGECHVPHESPPSFAIRATEPDHRGRSSVPDKGPVCYTLPKRHKQP